MRIIKCALCGIEVEATNNRQKYCEDCATLVGRERRNNYLKSDKGKKAQKRYLQSEKGKRANKKASSRYRANKRGAESDGWSHVEIWDRDEGLCQICGYPVYNNESAPKRLHAQYDHTIPLSCGGADTKENVRLTHAFCNGHKHDGVANIERCRDIIYQEMMRIPRRSIMNNIEEKIESRINGIDMTKYQTLKRLCQNIADFINMECTPHTTVEITSRGFIVNEAVTNGYLEDKEKE